VQLDQHGVEFARRARIPLQKRRPQAARPDGAVVRIEDLDGRIGDRRAAEAALLIGRRRRAGAGAADAAVTAGAGCRRREAGIAVLLLRERDGHAGRSGAALVDGLDGGAAAEGAGGLEQATGDVDAADLAAIDRPRRRHRDAVDLGRVLQRRDGPADGDRERLIERSDLERAAGHVAAAGEREIAVAAAAAAAADGEIVVAAAAAVATATAATTVPIGVTARERQHDERRREPQVSHARYLRQQIRRA
jgi:hypothetical protein